MKNLKAVFTLMIVGIVTSTLSVKAELSTDDYNRLRLVFSDAKISIMTDEEINKYLSYDLEGAKTESVFYKGTSNNNGSYTWTEISENEFANPELEIAPASSHTDDYATNYKALHLAAIDTGNGKNFIFYLDNLWKYIPAVRSFDVIGFRFYNVAVDDGTQSGVQFYRNKGSETMSSVSYSANGTNISKQANGFGISMNIVDNDIDYLELELDVEGIVAGTNPMVFGSYQHATNNVTLAQSKNYTISAAGMGGVINFDESLINTYDRMKGVNAQLS